MQKGFGFICAEGGGEDIFVHQSVLKSRGNGMGQRTLAEGENVEFEISPGNVCSVFSLFFPLHRCLGNKHLKFIFEIVI